MTEYPEYAKQVLEVVIKQFSEQEFINLQWGGMFRSLRNLLIQSKALLADSLYNANVLMIDDYSGSIQTVEPTACGRGQMVLLSHYYRFTKNAITKQMSYFSNKAQEKIGFSNQGSLLNQVGASRALDIYQFDEDVVIVEVNKETICKPIDNPQPGCLGMTGPVFAGFAAQMEKDWKQKQFSVFGICEAAYSGFLNYAMYKFSLMMFAFQVNTCNRGISEKKQEDKKPLPQNDRRLLKADRKSMLSALSSGKFNKKKAQKTRHEQH